VDGCCSAVAYVGICKELKMSSTVPNKAIRITKSLNW
jgi:hypothetical protein